MSTAASLLLSLDEYHQRYAGENGYEYWFGEVVRKSVPTWLHSILQAILVDLFDKAGYVSGSELDLRIDPDWEPRPDVAAALNPNLKERYPTKPVDIVAEILSPDDPMSRVFEKCRHYVRIGIPQIFVLDPELQLAWEWSRRTENLERVDSLRLGNGVVMETRDVWLELERRAKKAGRPKT
jgi:Uma2 family endonuclease